MRLLFYCLFLVCLGSCEAQTPKTLSHSLMDTLVGGPCEGCELMFEGMPQWIGPADTSIGWTGPGQQFLLKGKVYRPDGKTAAANIVLYYWQTDHLGYYTAAPGSSGKAGRHGKIRGWVKTDSTGAYAIYTTRPAPYPGERIPAHIHIVIKEPGMNEYYIDDVVFDDDVLLTGAERKKLEARGGSGILRVEASGKMQVGIRNIILGLNIPNHPSTSGGPGSIPNLSPAGTENAPVQQVNQ